MSRSCWLLAAIGLMATAAHAEPAIKDISGHRFCSNDAAHTDLRETGDGGYKVNIRVDDYGDPASAVYPSGGAKLFGPQGELRSYVSINYEFHLDAEGNPHDRPVPVRLGVSTGRFAGPRLEPLGSLTLQLGAGDAKSPPIGIDDGGYSLAIISGEVAPQGSENPYDTELPREQFEQLVDTFEQSSNRSIILSQNGREMARIPVPQQDLVPLREQAIAWVRKTTPLLKQGKCG